MTRQDVRTNLQSWLQTGNITNVLQVLTSFPKEFDFEYLSTAGQLTRAVLVIFIASESETRIASGGGVTVQGTDNGWKRGDYAVDVEIFVRSWQETSEAAMTDFDTIVDAVKLRLRQGGHRLGLANGDVIWAVAEPHINATYGMPLVRDDALIDIWCAIRFTATQMFIS